MGHTAVEKILARASGLLSVAVGDIIYPEADYVILQDMHAHKFLRELWEMGVHELWDPARVVVVIDHQVPTFSLRVANIHREIRHWVEKFRIENFFDVNTGISHQIQIEAGLARPGTLIISKDVHSPNAGAVGSLGIPLIYDVPAFLAMGTAWIRVPEVVRINLNGRPKAGVLARDIAQAVCAQLGYERCDYRVLEWGGSFVDALSIDGRQVLCNVAIEVGAKSAFVNPDSKAIASMEARTRVRFEPEVSDPDAHYALRFDIDVGTFEPQVAAPPSPDNVLAVSAVAGLPIQHAFVGSCAGGMLDDLRAAATILRDRKLAPGVRMLITPSTRLIYEAALAEGLIEVFAAAGAQVISAGCTACPGFVSPLADDERTICTATRNEPGRMGSHSAEIFIANPMTVAASAVAGRITDPREFLHGA